MDLEKLSINSKRNYGFFIQAVALISVSIINFVHLFFTLEVSISFFWIVRSILIITIVAELLSYKWVERGIYNFWVWFLNFSGFLLVWLPLANWHLFKL